MKYCLTENAESVINSCFQQMFSALCAAQGWTVTGMAEYIERDDALLALSYYHIGKPEPDDIIPAVLETARKSIAKINAADVAPVRHGRWVDNGIPDSMLDGCSECGFSCGAYGFRYCPNCGAKMDGGTQ